ncbi:PQQ-binding-like beta-propeller repeat protein [Verrucomicrobiota bacterium]
MKKVLVFCVAVFLSVVSVYAESGSGLIKASGVKGGLVVCVGADDLEFVAGLHADEKYLVHCLDVDQKKVDAARKYIQTRGLYGKVSVDTWDEERLPYADNLVNLLIISNIQQGISNDEVMRILAPRGVVMIRKNSQHSTSNIQHPSKEDKNSEISALGVQCEDKGDYLVFTKPVPPEIDDWTHFGHSAEGNMVSEDTVVGPPRHAQWVVEPMFQRHHAMTPGTTALVSSQGRIFYIQDEAPMGFAGVPDQWNLIARDAFNGKLLWKRKMTEWGDRVWSWFEGTHGARGNHPSHINKRLVAGKDRVFITLGYNAPVSALDPATGKTLMEYKETLYADEMVYRDNVLYVSVNDRSQKSLPGKGFSSEPTSENVSQKTIMAIEPVEGRILWKAGPYIGVGGKSGRMSSMKPTLLIASEKGVFFADQDNVVALDLKTGQERFEVPLRPLSGRTSFIYHKGMLFAANSKNACYAMDAETGETVWKRDKVGQMAWEPRPELFGIGDLLWISEYPKVMSMIGLNYLTGEEVKRMSLEKVMDVGHHSRCYPNKCTVNYYISGRRGTEFTNFKTGESTLAPWARGECGYGVMPANGLFYKVPDPCGCYLEGKLLGFYALASAEQTQVESSKERVARKKERLEKGPAFGKIPQSEFRNPKSEWPQFRHDAMRSGSVKTSIPDKLKKSWEVALKSKITPPVIAGGRVVVSAVDEHTIYAFDESNGKKLWTYTAGGRVDSPPSLYRGMVIFGSADGRVYCLRAEDGELVWRFRAAPYDRNILAYDQVESVWPLHGSLFMAGGVVYCNAGRSSFLDGGVYLYALDAVSGKVLGKNIAYEVLEEYGGMNHFPRDKGGASNILTTDGMKIYSRYRALDFGVPLKWDDDDYKYNRKEKLTVSSSFFDQFMFHRMTWSLGRNIIGNIIAFDEHSSCSAFMFKRPGNNNRKVYVPRGGDVSMIPDIRYIPEETIKFRADIEEGGFLLKMQGSESEWETKTFPVLPLSMVLAEKKVAIAGFMDEIDPADPWGGIEGRKGGVLWILSRADGKKLFEYSLETVPVWNGMAAANEKTFISLKNGTLICIDQGK